MIKSKHANKFYIEQYILNNVNNFQEWSESNIPLIVKDNAIIGYIFCSKDIGTLRETRILNLYLIKKQYCNNTEIVTENDLETAWKLFFNAPNKIVFKNPPIEEWIASKNNWCKKVATDMSRRFEKDYDEALSDVYFTVMRLYNKSTVYMGNLNYVKTSVINDILMDIRANKNKICQDNGVAISLSTKMVESTDGEEISLLDMIADNSDEYSEETFDFLETKNIAIKLLKRDFSEREIDQILNTKTQFMPRALYTKLLRWRAKHEAEEIYE